MNSKMRGDVNGLMAGLVTKARMPMGEPVVPDEPVAYLYNGVRLPDVYKAGESIFNTPPPYRIVYKAGDAYRLAIFPVAFSYITKDGASYIATNGERQMWMTFRHSTKYWIRHEADSASSTQLLIPIGNIVWTTHDLLYEDGSVFFAATEPIPVYE